MPSWTTWTRLEPVTRDSQLETSLRATVHDPLWMLARQNQLGEFEAEDGGTPVRVTHKYVQTTITQLHLGAYTDASTNSQNVVEYDGRPLETSIEWEPPAIDFRIRAEAGLDFIRMLGDLAPKYRSALLGQEYGLASDEEIRLSTILAHRIPDGQKLYKVFAETAQGQPFPLFEPSDQETIASKVSQWLSIYRAMFDPQPVNSAWIPERLEYEFAVEATNNKSKITFNAPGYLGGYLDWYSFDMDVTRSSPEANSDNNTQQFEESSGIPMPVRFPDMPSARFWEFEDAKASIGRPTAGPEDLAQIMLTEFALVYSDDFFIVPQVMPTGSVVQSICLTVYDTFGVDTNVNASARIDPQWRLFQCSPDVRWLHDRNTTNSLQLLFLPPTLGKTEHGEPLEEVLFTRDEMANLVWAIVRRVTEDSGTRDLYDNPATNSPNTTAWTFQLDTSVPTNWIPLATKQIVNSERATQLIVPGTDSSHPPKGLLLIPGQVINEEEIPRSGIKIVRRYEYARWQDGTHHLWVERYRSVGRGEAWSGLKFDHIALE